MRLLVLGSTGPTGLLLLQQARDRLWSVTTVVRSPDKLAHIPGQVDIVRGNVFDPSALASALRGADAAISVLGAHAGVLGKGATDVYSASARALCEALPEAGVRRLVFCTSAGVERDDPAEKLFYRRIAKPLFLQRGYDDMAEAESLIRASAMDWVLVRPGRLVGRDPSAPLRVSPRWRPAGGVDVSRVALANFLIEQVTDDTWLRGTPTITE